MSAPDRRGLLQRDHESLSIRRQCQLLSVARSSVYRPPRPANDNDLELMRRIDQLFTAWPFLGSRRMTAMLNGEGCRINRKRVQRLMRKMGIAALGPKPRTTKPAPGHRIFPYLLRHMVIDRPNQVWAADITYVPIGQGFLYLVAIIDWASRAVLAWRLSNTMDTSFCVSALEEALARFGQPEISARCEASSRQYGPGQPVHQRRLHRHAGRHWRQDLDGRSRTLDGQRVHRAAVAFAQIRGRLSQGLFGWPRGQSRNHPMDRVLQSPAPSSGAGKPRADGGLAGRCHRRIRRRGCGYDASRKREAWTTLRVAHIPTVTTAASKSSVKLSGRTNGSSST